MTASLCMNKQTAHAYGISLAIVNNSVGLCLDIVACAELHDCGIPTRENNRPQMHHRSKFCYDVNRFIKLLGPIKRMCSLMEVLRLCLQECRLRYKFPQEIAVFLIISSRVPKIVGFQICTIMIQAGNRSTFLQGLSIYGEVSVVKACIGSHQVEARMNACSI